MEPLFPNDIWAFNVPEIEDIEAIQFKIKWVIPKDKSKLFWQITQPDNPDYKVYASKLEFQIPSSADYNRIYCEGAVIIDKDDVAHFYNPEFYDPTQEEE